MYKEVPSKKGRRKGRKGGGEKGRGGCMKASGSRVGIERFDVLLYSARKAPKKPDLRLLRT